MKDIVVTTQAEFDALEDGFGERTRILIAGATERIAINANPKNCSIEGYDNCSIEGWGNCSIVGRGNCSIVGRDNCSIVGWGNCSIEGWGNCSIVGSDNCSIVGRGNCSIVGRDNCSIRVFSEYLRNIVLHGFSVVFVPSSITLNIEKKSIYCHIQITHDLGWFERNGIEKTETILLYKKVSKDWKTQEGTPNETLWTLGSHGVHPAWNPKNKECGEGKFHACSRPYFCDEFRNEVGDRYIALSIKLEDLHEWKDNPAYPHKIGFRAGTVLYECDKFGKEITVACKDKS